MKKKISKKILRAREKRAVKRELKIKLNSWKERIILRDVTCQRCLKDMTNFNKHVHHIISFQSVKRKYPELLEDINNGILLCGQCHKFNSDSPHQGGFEFSVWLEKNRPEQYLYLKEKLK